MSDKLDLKSSTTLASIIYQDLLHLYEDDEQPLLDNLVAAADQLLTSLRELQAQGALKGTHPHTDGWIHPSWNDHGTGFSNDPPPT